ncbi:hypothetical protein V8C42DRAFT_325312 [Trichoderma barbatum]
MKDSKFQKGGIPKLPSLRLKSRSYYLSSLPCLNSLSFCVCVFRPAWPPKVGPGAEPELIGKAPVLLFCRSFLCVSSICLYSLAIREKNEALKSTLYIEVYIQKTSKAFSFCSISGSKNVLDLLLLRLLDVGRRSRADAATRADGP